MYIAQANPESYVVAMFISSDWNNTIVQGTVDITAWWPSHYCNQPACAHTYSWSLAATVDSTGFARTRSRSQSMVAEASFDHSGVRVRPRGRSNPLKSNRHASVANVV